MTVSPQITVHSETNTATWSYMYLLSPWSPRSATTQVGKKQCEWCFSFSLFFFWKYHNNTFLKYLPMFYVRLYYTFVCIYFLFNMQKKTDIFYSPSYIIFCRRFFSKWGLMFAIFYHTSSLSLQLLDDITPPERLVKPSTPPAMTFCMHGEHARRHAAN